MASALIEADPLKLDVQCSGITHHALSLSFIRPKRAQRALRAPELKCQRATWPTPVRCAPKPSHQRLALPATVKALTDTGITLSGIKHTQAHLSTNRTQQTQQRVI